MRDELAEVIIEQIQTITTLQEALLNSARRELGAFILGLIVGVLIMRFL